MARWSGQRFEIVLDQLDRVEQIECGYRNGSDRMVILRCIGPDQFFLERVVFPFEVLSFNCPAHSEVEIWTHGLGGPELREAIASHELIVESLSTPECPAAALPSNPWLQAT